MSRFLALVAGALVAAAAGGDWRVRLVDVAAEAGLTQPSVYGGHDRKRFIIETNGAGVAWIDYDNDGWSDALVLSGTQLQEGTRQERAWPPGEAPSNRLYRNQHDGSFRDVTDVADPAKAAEFYSKAFGWREITRSPNLRDNPAEAPKAAPKTSDKVGRNDPCPCGSGKKYKKCHGK